MKQECEVNISSLIILNLIFLVSLQIIIDLLINLDVKLDFLNKFKLIHINIISMMTKLVKNMQ